MHHFAVATGIEIGHHSIEHLFDSHPPEMFALWVHYSSAIHLLSIHFSRVKRVRLELIVMYAMYR